MKKFKSTQIKGMSSSDYVGRYSSSLPCSCDQIPDKANQKQQQKNTKGKKSLFWIQSALIRKARQQQCKAFSLPLQPGSKCGQSIKLQSLTLVSLFLQQDSTSQGFNNLTKQSTEDQTVHHMSLWGNSLHSNHNSIKIMKKGNKLQNLYFKKLDYLIWGKGGKLKWTGCILDPWSFCILLPMQ